MVRTSEEQVANKMRVVPLEAWSPASEIAVHDDISMFHSHLACKLSVLKPRKEFVDGCSRMITASLAVLILILGALEVNDLEARSAHVDVQMSGLRSLQCELLTQAVRAEGSDGRLVHGGTEFYANTTSPPKRLAFDDCGSLIGNNEATTFCMANWLIDSYAWFWREQPPFRACYSGGGGREHPYYCQDLIVDFLVCGCLVYAVAMIVVYWPQSFIMDLRALIGLRWFEYTLSRWAQLLRFAALVLGATDAGSLLMSLVSQAPKVEQIKKRRNQGLSIEQIMHTFKADASDLKAAGFVASELKAVGFAASELRAAGFAASELKAAGFVASELRAAGFTAASELKAAGFAASELRLAGFTAASEFKAAGFAASELKAAGFRAASELRAAGVTASELKVSGFTVVSELRAAGFTASELKAAGFAASELRAASFHASQLKAAGFDLSEIAEVYFTASELEAVGLNLSGGWRQEPPTCGPKLEAASRVASKLKAAGFTALELKAAGFTALELKEAGFTASELKAAGFTASELSYKWAFGSLHLKAAGFTASELKAAGFTALELNEAGFWASALELELKNTGFMALELEKAASYLQRAGFTALGLTVAGFTLLQLKAAELLLLGNSSSGLHDIRPQVSPVNELKPAAFSA